MVHNPIVGEYYYAVEMYYDYDGTPLFALSPCQCLGMVKGNRIEAFMCGRPENDPCIERIPISLLVQFGKPVYATNTEWFGGDI